MLRSSQMQFCSAAPVPKYLPYSDSETSRCANANHHYCELFLALAHPRPEPTCPAERGAPRIEALNVPSGLCFSANHMWLSVSEDGGCHVGIDAFLARAVGCPDRLSFVTAKGFNRPAAVLAIRDAELPLVFPNKIMITATNNYLRVHPEKLLADPYGCGWLFEGKGQEVTSEDSEVGLMRGDKVKEWMAAEVRRLDQFARERLQPSSDLGGINLADGGSCIQGMATHLSREELLFLFNEFFPFYSSWRRSQ